MRTLPLPRAEMASVNTAVSIISAETQDSAVVDGVGRASHTLADITEPNVLERAGALAVNTLELVLADDDIAQGSAVLEDEDGAVTASVGISVACAAAVILLVAHVLGARDDAGLSKRDDGTRASRDVESLGRRGGGQRRHGEERLEKHLEDWRKEGAQ